MRLTSILIGIILLLSGAVYVLYTSNVKLKEEKQQAIDMNLASEKKLETYISDAGKKVSRTEVLELTTRNAKALAEDSRLKPVKQFKGVKKDLKNVENVILIDAVLNDTTVLEETSDSGVLIGGDSINSYKVYAGDNGEKILVSHHIVNLTGGVLWTRKWFLGKKKWYFDVKWDNPDVTVTGLSNIRIGKK